MKSNKRSVYTVEANARLALGQLDVVSGDKEANLQKIERAIAEAHTQQADLLLLPELVLTGFTPDMKALAESREGESLQQVQQMIATYPLHVLYSFPEIEGERVYITTVLLDSKGKPLAFYRKNHLFMQEAEQIAPGDRLVRLTVGAWRIGILTCYDIEFPEPARHLALQGLDLLLVNSANMTPYEEIHRLFIRARAAENQCFVAYCNRVGADRWFTYQGESAVVSPLGEVLMEVERQREVVQTTSLSLQRVAAAKEQYDYLQERRTSWS